MSKTVTLRDANQNFAKYVREAESGQELTITRRGEPVARLVPAKSGKRVPTPEQEAAWKRLKAAAGKYDLGPWPGRDALYDD